MYPQVSWAEILRSALRKGKKKKTKNFCALLFSFQLGYRGVRQWVVHGVVVVCHKALLPHVLLLNGI